MEFLIDGGGWLQILVIQTDSFPQISVRRLRAQPWAGRASEVLSVTGSLAEIAGAAGLPVAGLLGLALKLGAGVLKEDDVNKIKDIVTDHYEEVRSIMTGVDGRLWKLREDVMSILVVVLDTHYRNGILSIEAAFETFLNVDGSRRGLAEKLEEFRSHKFEVEKDYRHHMSPRKVEEYLSIVYRVQGIQACLSLWDFISLVQVKYLHMFLLYYFYTDNLTGALTQYDQFSSHYSEVDRRLRKVISLATVIPHFRAGRHCYRNVTQLTIACLKNQPDLVECLVTRLGADLSVRCSRRNRLVGSTSPLQVALQYKHNQAAALIEDHLKNVQN